MYTQSTRTERKRIITKLQERVQELNAEVEQLQKEIIFNQSFIRELQEQSVESSDDEISIEIIPNYNGKVKDKTRNHQQDKQQKGREKSFERARAWHLD